MRLGAFWGPKPSVLVNSINFFLFTFLKHTQDICSASFSTPVLWCPWGLCSFVPPFFLLLIDLFIYLFILFYFPLMPPKGCGERSWMLAPSSPARTLHGPPWREALVALIPLTIWLLGLMHLLNCSRTSLSNLRWSGVCDLPRKSCSELGQVTTVQQLLRILFFLAFWISSECAFICNTDSG